MQDYYFLYLQGNDTVTQLSNTDFFNRLVFLLDERAKQLLGVSSNPSLSQFLLTEKYNYMGLNDYDLTAILRGLYGPTTLILYIPRPSSSLMIEFYQKDGTVSTFDRSNYYVKVSMDDNSLTQALSNFITCDIQADTCSWASLATYLLSRTYQGSLRDMCFSQLHIVVPPDNSQEQVPWWLAIVISIPLAVITIAVIKIALLMREKKQREAAKEATPYNQLGDGAKKRTSVNNDK